MSEPSKTFLQGLEKNKFFPIIILLLVAILTDGPLINQLGYPNEAWNSLLRVEEEGPDSLISLHSGARLFPGWLNYFDYLFIGKNLLALNVYALLCRLFFGVGVYWLKIVIPETLPESTRYNLVDFNTSAVVN